MASISARLSPRVFSSDFFNLVHEGVEAARSRRVCRIGRKSKEEVKDSCRRHSSIQHSRPFISKHQKAILEIMEIFRKNSAKSTLSRRGVTDSLFVGGNPRWDADVADKERGEENRRNKWDGASTAVSYTYVYARLLCAVSKVVDYSFRFLRYYGEIRSRFPYFFIRSTIVIFTLRARSTFSSDT